MVFFQSPEYDLSEGKVRKVSSGGTIRVNQYESYVSQALSGEYTVLKEGANEGGDVFYGKVFLGKDIQGKGIVKPKINNLQVGEKCYPCM
ncbi:MAG: hypothetical protein ACI9S8_002682 [Chlamydiales bacterium]|jgi:hypothetical protein